MRNLALLLICICVNPTRSFAQDASIPPPIPLSLISHLTQEIATIQVSDILFEKNSFQIPNESILELKGLAKKLSAMETIYLLIEAHTDKTGSPEFNLTLSEQRANEVAMIFERDGSFHKNQLIKIGHGDKFATAADIEGQQMERKVKITILSTRAHPASAVSITDQLRERGVPIESWVFTHNPQEETKQIPPHSSGVKNRNNNIQLPISVGHLVPMINLKSPKFNSGTIARIGAYYTSKRKISLGVDASILQGSLDYQKSKHSFRSLQTNLAIGFSRQWMPHLFSIHSVKLGFQTYKVYNADNDSEQEDTSLPIMKPTLPIAISTKFLAPIPQSKYSGFAEFSVNTNRYLLETQILLGISRIYTP